MTNRTLKRFTLLLWGCFSVFAGCMLAFIFYARAENQVRVAYGIQVESLKLATELRQTSEDLTRMVRTYVVTGDPRYSAHYQQILDIRDGRSPRPADYSSVHWDLLPGASPPPDTVAPAALLMRIQSVGFTIPEMNKLSEAKLKSDALVSLERSAMQIADETPNEATTGNATAKRLAAIRMLHDATYLRAKAAIMGPISEFSHMVAMRTAAQVDLAQRHARFMMWVFIIACGALVTLLWRLRASFQAVLGGSVADLQAVMSKDPDPHTLKYTETESLLGRLAEVQLTRENSDGQRRESERALAEAERRFLEIAEAANESICVVQDALIRFANQALLSRIGSEQNELIGVPFIELVYPEDRNELMDRYRRRQTGDQNESSSTFRVIGKDGEVFGVSSQAKRFQWAGRPAVMYFLR
ncbi:PAS domain-containing protein [Silvimonas soli]|uniref:PAS domain-containing protein n=1 Tax=Silvimonas soli TaxID=2980100 RepID=UPI0024B36743|nr:PAS domain S-box protein [Silvimonas soli]